MTPPERGADSTLATSPITLCDWGIEGLRNDKGWQHAVAPAGSEHFAQVQQGKSPTWMMRRNRQ